MIFVITIATCELVSTALTCIGVLLVAFIQVIVAILKSHYRDSNQPRSESSLYYLLFTIM